MVIQDKNPTHELVPRQTPVVILAEGCFGEQQTKLALGVIRYGRWPIVAVIDSTRAGKTVREVTGIRCDAPIVATLEEAMTHGPRALMIGTAPAGGKLPEEWRGVLSQSLNAGLHIINGLHFFLTEDDELRDLAKANEAILWDVRDPDSYGPGRFEIINRMLPRPKTLRTITMVGTDCAVGKMHTALELQAGAEKRELASRFVATGQIGILIAGRGVPLDRIIGDFMAGAMELAIHDEIHILEKDHPNAETQWLIVEGQGSLWHPAYSGVTLSLLHGSNPDMMILCHKAGTEEVRNYPGLTLPSLKEMAEGYEQAAAQMRPNGRHAKVVGISVNSSPIVDDAEADKYMQQLEAETGLPVTDPVRYGVERLLNAIQAEERRLATAL